MALFTGISLFGQSKASGHLPGPFLIFIPSFWLIGFGMLAGAVHMGRRRAELAADTVALRIESTGLLGTKQRQWSRGDIAAIRADASGMKVNNRPVIELQIHPVAGKKAGFLGGRDEAELRWIAANLRNVLKVPAHRPQAG